MIHFVAVVICLSYLPQGQTELRLSTRRYKPVIQVTEEIDINDITFTTSSPNFDRPSSHKNINYYTGVKPERGSGGTSFNRISEVGPSVFPHVSHKESYGSSVPVEKIYSTGQPKIVVPSIKYKPYKVYKVQQEGSDGFRPAPHKAIAPEKPRLVIFEPPSTFNAVPSSESPKLYSTKVVPFSSQYSAHKTPTRSPSFLTQDNKNSIPASSFPPTVVTSATKEGSKKFSEPPHIQPFDSSDKKQTESPKPSKKPYHIKKFRKVAENHNYQGKGLSDDYSKSPEKPEQSFEGSSTLYTESPQQSESFVSEISTLHTGASGGNNLDGVAESLDLKTGERVEFQMYGMDGPQSYKFGFDTGKGHNRHFRFEERDNSGKVKGHYGYIDEDGKMRIMKYEADPITGFHAGPVEISPDEN